MRKTAIVIIILGISFAHIVFAQDSIPETKKEESFRTDSRHWTVEIPLWIPGFRGEFKYGDVEIEGEDGTIPTPEHPIEKPGFGDAFNRLFKSGGNLNFFFLTGINYNNNKFFADLDAISGSVGASLMFRYNNSKLVSAQMNTILLRLSSGYQLYEHSILKDKANYKLFPYAGIRIQSFTVKSDLDGLGKTLKVDPIWIEPLLGLKNELAFDSWKFLLQIDMGSFGINNKFSYMINFNTYYRIGNLLSFKFGWSNWYINYNNRFRDENLRLKVHLSGPQAALLFNF